MFDVDINIRKVIPNVIPNKLKKKILNQFSDIMKVIRKILSLLIHYVHVNGVHPYVLCYNENDILLIV